MKAKIYCIANYPYDEEEHLVTDNNSFALVVNGHKESIADFIHGMRAMATLLIEGEYSYYPQTENVQFADLNLKDDYEPEIDDEIDNSRQFSRMTQEALLELARKRIAEFENVEK